MRRQNFFWILTIPLVFVFQAILAEPISIAGVSPNFFLLATIFFAVRSGPVMGELLGFTWGMLSDVVSISLFGSQTFMLTLIGYLVGRLERQVDEEKYSAQMVLVLIMSILNILGLLFMETLFGGAAQTHRFRDRSAFLSPIYSTLFSPVLFWLLFHWSSIFDRAGSRIKSS